MPQYNQIYLDYCLDYKESVDIGQPQQIPDGITTSRNSDLARKRVVEVPKAEIYDGAFEFALPEEAVAGSVEVFVRGLMVDPALVSTPGPDEVVLVAAPMVPPVYIHYLPVEGKPSDNDSHIPYVTATPTSGTLNLPYINGGMVLFDTSNGPLEKTLPDMKWRDGVVIYLKNIGPNPATLRTYPGSAINRYYTAATLPNQYDSGKLIYVGKERNWMPKQNVEEVGRLFSIQVAMDAPLFDFIWEDIIP